MSTWSCVLELDSHRQVRHGSPAALRDAIRRGGDLRIYTEFRYNEHVDVTSGNAEPVCEVSDFRVTYLIEDRWAAGIMNLRMPITVPVGFGPRPSMSFFLYNEDGQQAIARPHLDGGPAQTELDGLSGDIPKFHLLNRVDGDTNAPSQNFIYDFDVYRFIVRDEWQEVLAHDADGTVRAGSLDALTEAFSRGAEMKVAIRNLCADLADDSTRISNHEVIIQMGPGYHCTEQRLFCAGSQPVVRVRPAIPMRYTSGGWDFGWLLVRTDGLVAQWLCDPYSLAFRKQEGRYGIRWFTR